MLTTLYHLFPPTIHPMVIHFTIALTYLTTLAGLAGLIFKKDNFFTRAFFFLLILSILATMAAGVAGVVSEYYVKTTPAVGRLLETHKNYGELTGVMLVIAFGVQWISQRRKYSVSLIAFAFSVIATILVSLTGHIGGLMVYGHGLGVSISHTLTNLKP